MDEKDTTITKRPKKYDPISKHVYSILGIIGGLIFIIGLNTPVPSAYGFVCFVVGGVVFGFGIVGRLGFFGVKYETPKENESASCGEVK
jgi:hypothetical protein